jgi:hypothetical protein
MKNNVLLLGLLLVIASLFLGAVKINKVVTGVECLILSVFSIIDLEHTLRCLMAGDAVRCLAVFGVAAMCFLAVISCCQISNSAIAKTTAKVSSACILMCVAALFLISLENRKSGIVYVEQYLLGYYVWMTGLFLSAVSQWLGEWHGQPDSKT